MAGCGCRGEVWGESETGPSPSRGKVKPIQHSLPEFLGTISPGSTPLGPVFFFFGGCASKSQRSQNHVEQWVGQWPGSSKFPPCKDSRRTCWHCSRSIAKVAADQHFLHPCKWFWRNDSHCCLVMPVNFFVGGVMLNSNEPQKINPVLYLFGGLVVSRKKRTRYIAHFQSTTFFWSKEFRGQFHSSYQTIAIFQGLCPNLNGVTTMPIAAILIWCLKNYAQYPPKYNVVGI